MITTLKKRFSRAGLDLYACLDFDAIPDDLRHAVQEAVVSGADDKNVRWRRLVLVGNLGARFWSNLIAADVRGTDPVDEFSLKQARNAAQVLPSDFRTSVLFPGTGRIPLQQLGEQAGWGSASWLGISIHPDFGTWYAFRAVFLTTFPLSCERLQTTRQPCVDCDGHQCWQACPTGAPGPPGEFNLDACIGYRLDIGSDCAGQCLARIACPLGTDYRYPGEVIDYFYRRSLEDMERWRR